MSKETVETLRAKGWKGYQRNVLTGNVVEARYPLDNIAWTMNNKPYRLCFINADIRKMVRVYIENEDWIPEKLHECYAERPMNTEEIVEANERLAILGVVVNS